MNKMERSLRELREMDTLAAGDSPIHRLCPLVKLLTTIAYIITVVSFGKYDLAGIAVMVLYPVLLFQLSGIPVSTCFYKLRFVLPLVMAVGLFNPLFDRTPLLTVGTLTISSGAVSMLTLMTKGVLCLMASFLLMATTSIDALCAAMRRLHLPGMLVTLLLLTYRYVGVMTEELAVMTDAYHLRAPGQRGIHRSAWGSFLGQLLLRSMDRAGELYTGMQLRGFRGEFHYAAAAPCTPGDAVYLIICAGAFLLCRLVNVAQLLGSLFVR
ncbi:MAG: cobalt ECF transporter T component CbiQ [Ruminococcaceae bacterium]|jgi:cobalt/nickel transport system permease protein|nr:cobalt ECF transporter T component CbiQ [Oscillospiraceae bacterium]